MVTYPSRDIRELTYLETPCHVATQQPCIYIYTNIYEYIYIVTYPSRDIRKLT